MNKEFIPNSLTLSNGLCGFLSIVMTTKEQYVYASVLIILAMIADRYDGIVARKLNIVSAIGKELDSICDVISFGAAPAFLIYSKINNSTEILILSIVALIVCAAYTCCGAYRLARFNVTTMTNGYYQGVPITTCGLILAVLALFKIPNFALVIMTAIFAYLMVSTIKIKKI